MKVTLRNTLILAATLVAPVAAKAEFFSIGSCPVGCTAYTWSAGIADVINKNVEGVEVTAEETKGYVANIKLLQDGELEASMATSLSSYEAWAASGDIICERKDENKKDSQTIQRCVRDGSNHC